jgi:hypothetical protein
MLIIHPPQPLPSREELIYQPSPLVGEGGGEGVFIVYKQTLNKVVKILFRLFRALSLQTAGLCVIVKIIIFLERWC